MSVLTRGIHEKDVYARTKRVAMTNQLVCMISTNMREKLLGMREDNAESCPCLGGTYSIRRVVRLHVMRKIQKSWYIVYHVLSACYLYFWSDILLRQITHRKRAIEEACCLVNIGRLYLLCQLASGARCSRRFENGSIKHTSRRTGRGFEKM